MKSLLTLLLVLSLGACRSPNSAQPLGSAHPTVSAVNHAGTYVCSRMGGMSGMCYISGYIITLDSVGLPTRLMISTFKENSVLDSAAITSMSIDRDSLNVTGQAMTVPGLSFRARVQGDTVFGNLYDLHGEGGPGIAIRE